MKAYDIIAYAYDAALHCEDCAEKRFGLDALDGEELVEDSEGNPVHPVFGSDEIDPGDCCDDCGCRFFNE